MTEKKEKILNAALELFANESYHGTSTSKVAKKAGVSEGLIFRHFGNKEGLLHEILRKGQEQLKLLYADVVMETDPQKVIEKAVNLPFDVKKEDYSFWKLQYKLKWELDMFDDSKYEPIKQAIANAFSKMGYKEPEKEADILMLLSGAIGESLLKNSLKEPESMRQFLLSKYKR
jgi:AcrR family transcriptional regulator